MIKAPCAIANGLSGPSNDEQNRVIVPILITGNDAAPLKKPVAWQIAPVTLRFGSRIGCAE